MTPFDWKRRKLQLLLVQSWCASLSNVPKPPTASPSLLYNAPQLYQQHLHDNLLFKGVINMERHKKAFYVLDMLFYVLYISNVWHWLFLYKVLVFPVMAPHWSFYSRLQVDLFWTHAIIYKQLFWSWVPCQYFLLESPNYWCSCSGKSIAVGGYRQWDDYWGCYCSQHIGGVGGHTRRGSAGSLELILGPLIQSALQ